MAANIQRYRSANDQIHAMKVVSKPGVLSRRGIFKESVTDRRIRRSAASRLWDAYFATPCGTSEAVELLDQVRRMPAGS